MTELIGSASMGLGHAEPLSPVLGSNLAWVVLGACLALAALAGLWLIHGWAAQPVGRQAMILLGVCLAALAFLATGFAFAMGGVQGSYPGLGPLSGLGREWIPYGEGRGLLGVEGFFLSGEAYDAGVYALFLFQAVLLCLAAAVAMGPWAGRGPRLVAVIYALAFGGLLYPAFANWVWGGGWLAHLGQTEELGHGVVDFAGSGVVNAVAGMAALGGLVAVRGRASAEEENTATPSSVLAGLLLAAVGWTAVSAASTYAVTDVRLAVAATNALVGLVSAAAVGLLYTWFAGGEPDMQSGVQTGLAGMVAVAAGAPFYPAWGAALVGGVAGILVPFATAALTPLVRERTGGAIVAVHGIGGLWGLIAVGLIADGRYGVGWNGIGERVYLGVVGQGVTGLWPAGQVAPDSTQLTAQLVGVGVLLLWAVVTWLVVAIPTAVLSWQPGRRAAAEAGAVETARETSASATASEGQAFAVRSDGGEAQGP